MYLIIKNYVSDTINMGATSKDKPKKRKKWADSGQLTLYWKKIYKKK